jgi:hypothetical protein
VGGGQLIVQRIEDWFQQLVQRGVQAGHAQAVVAMLLGTIGLLLWVAGTLGGFILVRWREIIVGGW